MNDIVTVGCGLLLVVMVGICYYGLRLAHFLRKENQKLLNKVAELEEREYVDTLIKEATKKLADALELCALYEGFLVQNWNNMEEAICIIEDCKERIEKGEFSDTDYLAYLKQDQQYNLDLLLGIGASLDNGTDSNVNLGGLMLGQPGEGKSFHLKDGEYDEILAQ